MGTQLELYIKVALVFIFKMQLPASVHCWRDMEGLLL